MDPFQRCRCQLIRQKARGVSRKLKSMRVPNVRSGIRHFGLIKLERSKVRVARNLLDFCTATVASLSVAHSVPNQHYRGYNAKRNRIVVDWVAAVDCSLRPKGRHYVLQQPFALISARDFIEEIRHEIV